MKIAFVYDRVNKWGGAERVLLALHKIWPQAPLYTAVYDPARAGWANIFQVHPSFIQHIPFAKSHHEFFPWLTPMAFETFNFDDYDVVLSVTSAEAKCIITKPKTLHICYCLTPTRYLWSSKKDYERSGFSGIMLKMMSETLKRWDLAASHRPDYYIAISERVKNRIERYYHRKVDSVIYPPVTVSQRSHLESRKKNYFLTVSRLVKYKRIDIIVRAFNELGLPLIIIGEGREKQALMSIAQKNIIFINRHLTDSELVRYYEECRAFVFAADEDFGLGAAEAQLYGAPVIAYRESGVSEFVKDGVSGVLFDEQNSKGLIQAVHTFLKQQYVPSDCRKQIKKMSEQQFVKNMYQTVKKLAESTLL